MKKSFLVLAVILQCAIYNLHPVFSQNIAINATGATPNPSAGLDIDFTNLGLLIPRMTTAQRNAIVSPANSLLIFNTTSACFEAYNSAASSWQSVFCMCTIPAAPTATAASSVTSSSFVANWGPVGGATTYYLDVNTNSTFTGTWILNNVNVGNVTNYTVTGLTSGTTYYYRVRAGNVCGTSGDSNTISVTTTSSCPTATNPSSMGNAWYTTTYQSGYEFSQVVTKTICQVDYLYSGTIGTTGWIRFYTSGGTLISSTSITTSSITWTTVTLSSPVTLSAGSSYIIVYDMNNGNAGGDFTTTAAVTYDSSVISYITGRYNNASCCVFPSQTWGGYWGCLQMKY